MISAKEELALMAYYGITSEQKVVYHYKQHRYQKIEDAINFARLDSSKSNYSLESSNCKQSE
jgi:hypothetical protein